jgi:hypothetical protein
MEPEGSLPSSQEPSTGPYPEPDRSNPHLRLGLPSGLLPSRFPTNNLYAFVFALFMVRALPISSSLTWLF